MQVRDNTEANKVATRKINITGDKSMVDRELLWNLQVYKEWQGLHRKKSAQELRVLFVEA